MKRLWLLAGVPLIILWFGSSAQAQNPQNFTISSFEADYTLTRDEAKTSQLKISEKIVAEFPDIDQNHGILRAIPAKYQGHTVSLNIESVKKQDGSNWHYSSYKQNDNLVLKIGDPNQFVHGQQTYLISYSLRNVINFQSTGDEFYWDINGDQWPQSFEHLAVNIHIPAQLKDSLQAKQVCYAGYFGSTNQSCRISRQDENNGILVTASADNLAAYQTLSVVLAFAPGIFQAGPEIAHEKQIQKIKAVLTILAVSLPMTVAFGLMLNRWRKFGDDPKGRGVIIPEYQPPKDLDVLASDFLLKGELRPQAISASLIEQATSKHLTIYEIPKHGLFGKKDYELQLNSVAPNLRAETKAILTAIFGELTQGSKIKISDFKARAAKAELYEDLQKAKDQLAENLYQEGYYIKNPSQTRSGYQAWSLLPFLAGLGLMFVPRADFYPLIGLAVGLMLAAVVMFLFAFIMPARSQKGVTVHDYLLGLRDYIKLAEADRLKYLQSAEGTQKITDPAGFNPGTDVAKIKLFESLLPYAMLFGLEKSWAKQFEGLYAKPPDWYQGNPSAFQTGIIVGSLADFNTSASTNFSAPSSTGGSGFAGGAGGGGGGGGGGGW